MMVIKKWAKGWIKIETKLRETHWIRVVWKPYKDWQLRHIIKNYQKEGYADALREIKDIGKGKRCFIIGNGPSLTAQDLDKLKNEYTFAANRIYKMFDKTDWRPWSYVVIDTDLLRTDQENIMKVPSTYKFLRYKLKKYFGDVPVLWIVEDVEFPISAASDMSAHIVEDITKGISRGWTVTYASLQLAIYMGFQEIYLLGIDFSYPVLVDKEGNAHRQEGVYSHFDRDKNDIAVMPVDVQRHAYQTARDYCESHGITIKNATRGGMLEVFERVDFDELFRGGTEK